MAAKGPASSPISGNIHLQSKFFAILKQTIAPVSDRNSSNCITDGRTKLSLECSGRNLMSPWSNVKKTGRV